MVGMGRNEKIKQNLMELSYFGMLNWHYSKQKFDLLYAFKSHSCLKFEDDQNMSIGSEDMAEKVLSETFLLVSLYL